MSTLSLKSCGRLDLRAVPYPTLRALHSFFVTAASHHPEDDVREYLLVFADFREWLRGIREGRTDVHLLRDPETGDVYLRLVVMGDDDWVGLAFPAAAAVGLDAPFLREAIDEAVARGLVVISDISIEAAAGYDLPEFTVPDDLSGEDDPDAA